MSKRDWSSDVCSSDLGPGYGVTPTCRTYRATSPKCGILIRSGLILSLCQPQWSMRSEERRVGKECRTRRWRSAETTETTQPTGHRTKKRADHNKERVH